MKLNLDGQPMNMGTALTLAFKMIKDYPNQEVGTRGRVYQEENGVMFSLTRNQDSYTIREVVE